MIMKICYNEKNPSIPVLLVGLTASGKLFSDWAHIDVAFPISIGFSVYPFCYVVTLFHLLLQSIPWFYVRLWPACIAKS